MTGLARSTTSAQCARSSATSPATTATRTGGRWAATADDRRRPQARAAGSGIGVRAACGLRFAARRPPSAGPATRRRMPAAAGARRAATLPGRRSSTTAARPPAARAAGGHGPRVRRPRPPRPGCAGWSARRRAAAGSAADASRRRRASPSAWAATCAMSRPASASVCDRVEGRSRRRRPRRRRPARRSRRRRRGRPPRALGCGEPVVGEGQHLVEQRLGVAHAAIGQAGDERQRLGVGLGAFGGDDAGQLADDGRIGDAAEVEALGAADDGGRHLVRVGRGQDEDDVVGRLLDQLEQRVEGVRC